MRIVLDLQGAQTESRYRGIGRYSLSLAQAIARNAASHEIWIVLSACFPDTIPNIRHSFQGLVAPERIRVFELPLPIEGRDPRNSWRTLAAERIREDFIARLNPDVVHISSLFEGYIDNATTSVCAVPKTYHTVVTHYDLIPLVSPEIYLSTPAYHRFYLRKIDSLKNASLLLAISEASRQELLDKLALPNTAAVNISGAVAGDFGPMSMEQASAINVRRAYGIHRRMVMYAPGGFDPRKNVANLIKAYSLLSPTVRSTHQLVIVSKISEDFRSELMLAAKRVGLSEDELVLTGYVTEAELIGLYNLAALFVFPSKHEGLGLPALEAMACGTPTIGSNTSSIPEVIGCESALFDPEDPQAISMKISEVLSDECLQVKLREHGLRQAGKFSWDRSAQLALAAIESLPKPWSDIRGPELDHDAKALIASLARIEAPAKPSLADLRAVASVIAFNIRQGTRKQLFLDISELAQRDAKSGIQRVVRSILSELLSQDLECYSFCPIYFDGRQYRHANQFVSRFMNQPDGPALSDPTVEFHQDDIYLSLDLNVHITPLVHDLHKYLYDVGVRMYFVVYDILLVQRPDWWPQGTSSMFENWLRSLAQVATRLICISESVAKEVQDWLSDTNVGAQHGPTVTSFHLGADVENSVPSRGLPEDVNQVMAQLASRPSFLCVGTVEPRKGYAQVLSGFEVLWGGGEDINLILVGKQGWLVESLAEKLRAHPEINHRLFWLEGISDEYLEKIYSASTCLIAASEGEGFGLPLIEAAQHGKPIIARNLAVFREVAGDHAFYFHGLTSHDLATAVSSWLALWRQGAHPSSDGLRYVSWRESTQELLASMNLKIDSYVKA